VNRQLRRFAGALLLVLGLIQMSASLAHPMPNTAIAIALADDAVRFDVAVPASELRLALPRDWPRDVNLLAEPQRSAVLDYFSRHFAVRDAAGHLRQHRIVSINRQQTSDPNVGPYEELQVRFIVAAGAGLNPRDFTLHYDAVIHQVPNHFALVHIAQDFRAGRLTGETPAQLGVIRYDFARDIVPGLTVNLESGSVFRGLGAAMALGFMHVAGGLDHLLFLFALLIVAPLRSVEGRWSLFQGWRFAARRFLGISLAFTLGHSIALILGTYELVPVSRTAVEVLIAASIVLTAIHAIRPLWAGRERLIAAGFGTMHGLAFSGALTQLELTPWSRAFTILGFNIGVEGAQLAAMAVVAPLLLASRWRWFHGFRVATMIVTALLSGAWMLERALPQTQEVGAACLVMCQSAQGLAFAQRLEQAAPCKADDDRRAAAEYDRADDAKDSGSHARFEFTKLVAGADEQRVHGSDAPA
jgi:hypothetical protein